MLMEDYDVLAVCEPLNLTLLRVVVTKAILLKGVDYHVILLQE